MSGRNFDEVIRLIEKKDPRYSRGAYDFVRKGLAFTLKNLEKEQKGGHVKGDTLCEGLRQYALAQFGPMTLTLLHSWGITETIDFGNIVFNLIDYEIFGKADDDRLEDFKDVYDFHEAFELPFLPENKKLNNPRNSDNVD